MADCIAIIGAGISGAWLAYRLAAAGQTVLVIDDERTGRATGWNPGGINPLHGPGFPGVMEDFYREAFEIHSAQYEHIQSASGIDFGWRVVDRLFLASSAAEADQLREHQLHYKLFPGFSGEWLDQAELIGWDSRVAAGWTGGLLTRGNVRVDSERYRLALLTAASAIGAQLITGTLKCVGVNGDRITSIDWGQGRTAVSALCMATGSWSGDAIDGWSPGATVPVSALIGDLLLVRSNATPPLADINHGLTAIYQHEGDCFWIGGTTRREGPLGKTTEEIERRLIDGAQALMPGWAISEVVGRSSAARPSSADQLPIVGRTLNYQNGWIINGLGGKGILLSAWAADCMVRMIRAGEELPELARVSPSRPIEDSWQKTIA